MTEKLLAALLLAVLAVPGRGRRTAPRGRPRTSCSARQPPAPAQPAAEAERRPWRGHGSRGRPSRSCSGPDPPGPPPPPRRPGSSRGSRRTGSGSAASSSSWARSPPTRTPNPATGPSPRPTCWTSTWTRAPTTGCAGLRARAVPLGPERRPRRQRGRPGPPPSGWFQLRPDHDQPGRVLDQLWINFDVAHRAFVTVGRQHVKWGVGKFWNPTDYLHPVRRDPLATFDARTGTTMLKLHVPWEKRGWNFYAVSPARGRWRATRRSPPTGSGASAWAAGPRSCWAAPSWGWTPWPRTATARAMALDLSGWAWATSTSTREVALRTGGPTAPAGCVRRRSPPGPLPELRGWVPDVASAAHAAGGGRRDLGLQVLGPGLAHRRSGVLLQPAGLRRPERLSVPAAGRADVHHRALSARLDRPAGRQGIPALLRRQALRGREPVPAPARTLERHDPHPLGAREPVRQELPGPAGLHPCWR